MTIQSFAERHKLRLKRDEEGSQIVMARHGQIYNFGRGQFGVMFLDTSTLRWNKSRKECEAAGMHLVQDGDAEGCLLFDPEDRDQSKVAIRMVGARAKRQVSPEQRAAAAERFKLWRESKNVA